MFAQFLRRDRQRGRIASTLYGAIVAQSRTPVFYASFGVPDSVDGRFALLVVHLALVLRRLGDADQVSKDLGQEVFDLFCQDMDQSLREIGVGDLSVPKKMKRLAEAYYGRAAAYGAALDSGDKKALAELVERNLLDGGSGAVDRIVAYLQDSDVLLRSEPLASFREGRVAWPDADAFGLGSAA
jgi:cytochrome b pre-mRNA-processing protein 3